MVRYSVSLRFAATVSVIVTLIAGGMLTVVAGDFSDHDAAANESRHDREQISSHEQTSSQESVLQDPVSQQYSAMELRAWGISGNCIESHRIRNIRFRDDESAIVQVAGGKRVLMTLERRCPGIRSRGFLHQTRINRLCTSDTLRVIDTGSICMIRSFTPYPEERDPDDQNP